MNLRYIYLTRNALKLACGKLGSKKIPRGGHVERDRGVGLTRGGEDMRREVTEEMEGVWRWSSGGSMRGWWGRFAIAPRGSKKKFV